MSEVNSAQAAKIAASTKLSTNEQGTVKALVITTPATFAQLEIGDTMATGQVIPKGSRIIGVTKQHGTGTASSTADIGLRKRDGTVVSATALCSVTALTTATTTEVECGNGAYLAAGVDQVLADDCEVYLTAKGAVLAANQDVRFVVRYVGG